MLPSWELEDDAIAEVEDPDILDDRRAAVGLEPFAEYERRIQSLYPPEDGDEHHDDNG